jgi:hypothetical protein
MNTDEHRCGVRASPACHRPSHPPLASRGARRRGDLVPGWRASILRSHGSWGLVAVPRGGGPADWYPADWYMGSCLLAHATRGPECHREAHSAVAISGQGGTLVTPRPTHPSHGSWGLVAAPRGCGWADWYMGSYPLARAARLELTGTWGSSLFSRKTTLAGWRPGPARPGRWTPCQIHRGARRARRGTLPSSCTEASAPDGKRRYRLAPAPGSSGRKQKAGS